MSKNHLVSIIVPTRNSSQYLDACLSSIKQQTYQPIEIIVVDNNSTDDTKKIAKHHGALVLNQGPERSAQVNYGVSKAKGQYVYKVDSDFILDKRVVEQCVHKIAEGFDAVVVHNSPDTSVSWIAKIRKFEVDMYKYDLTHSSARFVKKNIYKKIGGFDDDITAGEDYDFQNKLNRAGYRTGFIDEEALHLGEPTSFWKHMIKYYTYGKDFRKYRSKNKDNAGKQLSFFRNTYFKHWKHFAVNPVLGLAFILYHSTKYVFGALGYIIGSKPSK